MKYAVFNSNNVVVNLIEWDGQTPWQPPENHAAVLAPDEVDIDWYYIDGEFTPPLS